MDDAVRLLKVAVRELGAHSVRLELADEPHEDASEIACSVQGPWRVVARFHEPPADRKTKRRALQALLDTFRDVLHDATTQAPSLQPASATDRSGELAEMLEILRERLAARVVFIIDEHSPVVWASAPVLPWLHDVNAVLETIERRGLIQMRASLTEAPSTEPLASIIEHALVRARKDRHGEWDVGDTGGFCVKSFAGIYRLIVIFDGPVSPLAAESTLRRALPVIERIVSALPPRDPEPNTRNVLSLRKP